MDREVRKGNKVPGFDQLTRPEEIKALSKYLGYIKDTQDEHTKLYDEVAGVPGRTAGKVPNITALPDSVVGINGDNIPGITELSDIILGVTGEVETPELVTAKVDIEGEIKDPELSKTVLSIEGNMRTPELSDEVLGIEGDMRTPELSNEVLGIEGEIETPKLETARIGIEGEIEKEPELSGISKILPGTPVNPELSERREDLEVSESIELETTRFDIDNTPTILKLEDTQDTMAGEIETPELSETVLNIKGEIKETGLYEDYNISLPSTIEEQSLTEGLESLPGIIEEQSLESNLESLPSTIEEQNLNEGLESLPGIIEEQNLESNLESLPSTIDEQNLVESLESLPGTVKEQNLKNNLESLPGTVGKPELPGETSELPAELLEQNLGEIKENLPGTIEEQDLGEIKENLPAEIPDVDLGEVTKELPGEVEGQGLTDWLETLLDESEEEALGESIINLPSSNVSGPSKISNELLSVPHLSSQEETYFGAGSNLYEEYNIALPEEGGGIPEAELKDTLKLMEPDQDSYKDLRTSGFGNTDGVDIYKILVDFINHQGLNAEWGEKILALASSIADPNLEIPNWVSEGEEDTKANYEARLNDIYNIINRTVKSSIDANNTVPNAFSKTTEKGETESDLNSRVDNRFNESDTKIPTFGEIDGYVHYQLPGFNTGSASAWVDSIDINKYIRWLTEEAIDLTNAHGAVRQWLLTETLALAVWSRDLLEKANGNYRYRLPGSEPFNWLDPVGSLIDSGVSALAGSSNPNRNLPLNRPPGHTKDSDGNSTPIEVKGWDGANANYTTEDWKSGIGTGNNLGMTDVPQESKSVNFKSRYLGGYGIATTISELCKDTSASNISSVDDLFNKLRDSDYFFTPEKVMKTGNGPFRFTTLDSNAYWEMIFEPYVGELNGNKSFLPAFHEINTRNWTYHQILTAFNKWVPVTSFELSKSKLTSKSVSLYDGEISFPVAAELINEFRMTIADDQFKSWKTYFELCSDVATYSSIAHDSKYYDLSNFSKQEELTWVDKSNVIVAMYKNIAFRCRIYIMTPQLSTIKKYDLLLVLRDFIEESSGEIEASGTDLNLTFSIVGENPEGTRVTDEGMFYKTTGATCGEPEDITFTGGTSTADSLISAATTAISLIDFT